MLAVCSAAKVELDGREVFSSPQAVERLEWTRDGGGERIRPAVTKVFLGGGAAARNCCNLESGRIQ